MPKKRARWSALWIALTVVGAPLLSACGGTSHQATTSALKRKRLQRRRDQVTWVATFDGSAARQFAKLSLDHRTTSGQWHLVFGAKLVHLTNPQQVPAAAGVLLSTSRLGLTGGKMRFAADPKCPDQSKATTGLYSYRVSGNRLTIREVDHSDSCSARVKVLTTKTWTKGP